MKKIIEKKKIFDHHYSYLDNNAFGTKTAEEKSNKTHLKDFQSKRHPSEPARFSRSL